ncbi:MAG: hypothetical protein NC350_01645 [Corallococcus sp.]|nr:hypothetical protein [Corallococcus sp.]
MVKMSLNLLNIDTLIEQNNYTIETLSEKIGVSAAVTEKYLKSKKAKLTFCIGLARALNTTLAQVVKQ